jgi:hypothetical protein
MDVTPALLGEAMAAVTGGLERILASPVVPIGRAKQREARALIDGMLDAVKEALDGEGTDEPLETPEGEYMPILQTLTDPKKAPTPADRAKLAGGLIPVFSKPYTMWFDAAFRTAAGLIPRRTWVNIMGPHAVEPSSSELGMWWRAWDVARDPMVVIARMADGSLVSDEMDALGMFYPALRVMMTLAVYTGLADLAVKHGEDWLPADRTQRAVETFVGFSPLTPEFAAQLQQAAGAARQGEADQQAAGGMMGPMVDGPKLETQTQRLSER